MGPSTRLLVHLAGLLRQEHRTGVESPEWPFPALAQGPEASSRSGGIKDDNRSGAAQFASCRVEVLRHSVVSGFSRTEGYRKRGTSVPHAPRKSRVYTGLFSFVAEAIVCESRVASFLGA